MIDHDAKPGPLSRCQICGSEGLRLIMDLGHQPPCDAYLSAAQLNAPELSYPLRLNQCEQCSLAQLDYVVPAETLYPHDYPYCAGISWPVVKAHEEMAGSLVGRFGKGFCVDIGSNDGTLLSKFQALDCKVLGVEPTGIADIAEMVNDVPTLHRFFSESAARAIVDGYGQAHLITMTNVFAHIADLGEAMRGILALLAPNGVLVIENHYLLDVLERNQFDTIYHEHVRNYSLKALMVLFEQYGLQVFDVERVARYGGNIRAYVARKGTRSVSDRVFQLREHERESGLYQAASWAGFRERVYEARDRFMAFMYSEYRAGQSMAGCSAPGRASTLLNFYGVKPDLMPYLGELADSLKLGHFVPGAHIPIVSNARFIDEQPDYLVLNAWHYAEEIAQRLKREGVRSKLVMPLPEFKVIE